MESAELRKGCHIKDVAPGHRHIPARLALVEKEHRSDIIREVEHRLLDRHTSLQGHGGVHHALKEEQHVVTRLRLVVRPVQLYLDHEVIVVVRSEGIAHRGEPRHFRHGEVLGGLPVLLIGDIELPLHLLGEDELQPVVLETARLPVGIAPEDLEETARLHHIGRTIEGDALKDIAPVCVEVISGVHPLRPVHPAVLVQILLRKLPEHLRILPDVVLRIHHVGDYLHIGVKPPGEVYIAPGVEGVPLLQVDGLRGIVIAEHHPEEFRHPDEVFSRGVRSLEEVCEGEGCRGEGLVVKEGQGHPRTAHQGVGGVEEGGLQVKGVLPGVGREGDGLQEAEEVDHGSLQVAAEILHLPLGVGMLQGEEEVSSCTALGGVGLPVLGRRGIDAHYTGGLRCARMIDRLVCGEILRDAVVSRSEVELRIQVIRHIACED